MSQDGGNISLQNKWSMYFLQYGIIRIKLFFISKDLCINDVIGKVYFFSSLECEVNSDE